ncbi:hypothetical protein [Roseibium sediminicola]|uniref:Uncharacterized protein n=1 Tax=Roseibium sediminicola TaxID=2933272 RepID=A0ABT0GVX7_9HYPH|nr:hypothetical protein [Roseibium sp. CAU 1639]MCK7613594.1 hypothetical protein [Roseibium sp. CAU 1639]
MLAGVLVLLAAIYRIVLNFNLFRHDRHGLLNLICLSVILASTLFFLYAGFDSMFVRSDLIRFLSLDGAWFAGALVAADLICSVLQVIRAFRSERGPHFRILRCVSLLLLCAVVIIGAGAAVGAAPL